jgi:hypothetical protein
MVTLKLDSTKVDKKSHRTQIKKNNKILVNKTEKIKLKEKNQTSPSEPVHPS